MESQVTSVIGLLAGICTTGSLLPQVYKTLKSRNARDISLLMYVLMSAGIFLWFVYGILLNEMPIMLANGVSLLLTMGVLFLKIRHG